MPELCLKVVTEPPQSLAELRPGVPPTLVEVIERCLSKDVAQRFADAAELASALEPFVPVASRVTVERARLAMGTTGGRSTSAQAAVAAASGPARTGPTPSAWGSGKGQAPVADKARGPALWIGVGFAVAAAVGVTVFLLRGHADVGSTPGAGVVPPATTVVSVPAPPPAAASAAVAPASTPPTAADTGSG